MASARLRGTHGRPQTAPVLPGADHDRRERPTPRKTGEPGAAWPQARRGRPARRLELARVRARDVGVEARCARAVALEPGPGLRLPELRLAGSCAARAQRRGVLRERRARRRARGRPPHRSARASSPERSLSELSALSDYGARAEQGGSPSLCSERRAASTTGRSATRRRSRSRARR